MPIVSPRDEDSDSDVESEIHHTVYMIRLNKMNEWEALFSVDGVRSQYWEGFKVRDLDQNACAIAMDKCRRRYSRGNYEGVLLSTGRAITRSQTRITDKPPRREPALHMNDEKECVVNSFLNVLEKQPSFAEHPARTTFLSVITTQCAGDRCVYELKQLLESEPVSKALPRNLSASIHGLNLRGRTPSYEDLTSGLYLLELDTCEGGQRHCISVDADQGIVCDPALGYISLEAFLLYESRSAPTTIASIYRVCIRTSTKRGR